MPSDRLDRMATLILHGGAGRIDDERAAAYHRGLRAALEAGWAALTATATDPVSTDADAGDSAGGGSGGGTGSGTASGTGSGTRSGTGSRDGSRALAAVVAAVATMEANPEAFNAGVGSALTRAGTVECDACLMDGRDGRAGAVAVVTRAPSPIGLARSVMERSPHVLLVGAGADALVAEPIEPAVLVTSGARARLERWRERQHERGGDLEPTGSATVGAVALDDDGALAAATSTGGVLGQWPGRVGDAPIPGAGTYADARVAVSCTGKGEAFLRAVSAKALAERLAAGAVLEQALQRALDDVRAMDGSGGLIVVLADGRLAWAFDTSHMALAWRSDGALGEAPSGPLAEAQPGPLAGAQISAHEHVAVANEAGVFTWPARDAP